MGRQGRTLAMDCSNGESLSPRDLPVPWLIMDSYAQADPSGGDGAQYYRAARMYNSGVVDPSGDLGNGCCTHCYGTSGQISRSCFDVLLTMLLPTASDIANRLRGWVDAPSLCTLDDAGDTDTSTNSSILSDPAATTTMLGEWTSTTVAAVATSTDNTGQWSASEADDGQWSQWSPQS